MAFKCEGCGEFFEGYAPKDVQGKLSGIRLRIKIETLLDGHKCDLCEDCLLVALNATFSHEENE